MKCERYAVWWVPQQDSRLARFGAEWTGWCPERGSRDPVSELSRFADTHANLPAALRLRGLHAPIGPAFRLAEDRSPWALERALAECAARMAPIALSPLRLEIDDNRVRLAFEPAQAALTELVSDVTEALHPLHMIAPLDGAASTGMSVNSGMARRDDAGAAESAMRPCLWLSGSSSAAAEIMARLAPILAPILDEPAMLSDLALICDPGGNRPWRVLERFELQGSPGAGQRPIPSGMDCFGPRLFTPLGAMARAAA